MAMVAWNPYALALVSACAYLGYSSVSLAENAPDPSPSASASGGASTPTEDLPRVIPYRPNEPIPPGYEVRQRMRKEFVIGGAIGAGLFYGASVFYGVRELDSPNAPYGLMFLPVFGPFIVAATGDFVNTKNVFGGTNSPRAFPIFLGVTQTAGVGVLLFGLFAGGKALVRKDASNIQRPELLVGPSSVGMKLAF